MRGLGEKRSWELSRSGLWAHLYMSKFDKSMVYFFRIILKMSGLLLSIYMDNHFLDMAAVLLDR